MEVFFKNLTSEEETTDQLLHDLSLAKEGAEELFEVANGKLPEQSKERFLTGLERLKAACRGAQTRAAASARAADQAIQEHPYAVAGIAFGVGLVIGALAWSHLSGGTDQDEEP